MKKLTCVLAILAAASTATLAGEIKQDKNAAAPAVSATQMTESEMDKVTASGTHTFSNNGIEAFSMITAPHTQPAGVLENSQRQVILGPN